ncbi:hypothetical protein SAMN00790413_03594 [Deinococcus hopiensis KR-140]|uniref:Uncharacterized protein n=1 Tax=Deinococcus hopiensis KR-140 TaxID=695939 RepID=A0A1W1UXT0_9DEIO|nr:hypothetical protein SAMN00790413_03594 [Deinococcus hopiensis KR-140]
MPNSHRHPAAASGGCRCACEFLTRSTSMADQTYLTVSRGSPHNCTLPPLSPGRKRDA